MTMPELYKISNTTSAAAPTITQEPLSQAICPNTDVTFSIVASGTTAYQ